ncbi:MAG: hypothetical protein JJU15_20825 [Pararhodobacter sp.]|nr:hypothetical protein [Pararhodobacter sp.]
MITELADFGDASLERILPTHALARKLLSEVVSDPSEFGFAIYSITNRVKTGMLNFLKSIPDAVMDAHRNNKVGIILDNSGEGNIISDSVFSDWYSAFDKLGVNPQNVIYISQDVELDRLHQVYLVKFQRALGIHIGYHHRFLRRVVREAKRKIQTEDDFMRRERAFYSADRPDSVALCLMHKVRPRRAQLALNLIEHGMWDRTLISFGGVDKDEIRLDRFQSKFGRRPKSILDRLNELDLNPNLMRHLSTLRSYGRVLIDAEDPLNGKHHGASHQMVDDLSEELYKRTRFSIVSETEMGSRMNRFTEKSVKPLANYHCMIVFGNPFTLHLLHRLGFKTFNNVIDESYDGILNPDRRFTAAFRETRRLWLLSASEWSDILMEIDSVLKFNAHHFFWGLEDVMTDTMDKPLLLKLNCIRSAQVDLNSTQS